MNIKVDFVKDKKIPFFTHFLPMNKALKGWLVRA